TGAVVGNMMYGTNGMILGALLGATHDEYINSLSVKLYLTNNTYYIIPIITKKTLKSSKEYKEKANTLDWLVNKLDGIKEHC
ncbi:MAG: hypothetical protein K6G28_02675, partial [Acholeplasmatales bacterium]|nr:hypothetical protein [Acholeplasmatales bacterium]